MSVYTRPVYSYLLQFIILFYKMITVSCFKHAWFAFSPHNINSSILFQESTKPPDSFPNPHHFRNVVELTDDTFEQTTTHGSFFVKFFTPWCPVCQELSPKWVSLAEQMPDPTSYTIAEVILSHLSKSSKH